MNKLVYTGIVFGIVWGIGVTIGYLVRGQGARGGNKIRNQIKEEFEPYFNAMIESMLDNYQVKGDSWKTLSWSYLMDKLSVQFEDMINRDDEDFYANIGNYGAMLWLNDKSGRFEMEDQE